MCTLRHKNAHFFHVMNVQFRDPRCQLCNQQVNGNYLPKRKKKTGKQKLNFQISNQFKGTDIILKLENSSQKQF